MLWALPTNSFRIVRCVLGVVLLIAAALKGYVVATEPVIGTGILDTRWFAIAVVNVELFCGIWLLTHWLPVWTCRGTIALFSLFALVSVSKIIAGEASCGCFGRVPVSPWWTLGFDLAVVVALVWSRPLSSADEASGGGRVASGYAMAMPAFAFLAIAVAANVIMASSRSSVLDADGVIAGDSNIVVLEPEKWVRKPFPLLKFIDIGEQLSTGRWRVLLYHHDCQSCQDVLKQYAAGEWLAATNEAGGVNLALVEMSPYRSIRDANIPNAWMGVLKGDFVWFVDTPVEVAIENGDVRRVHKVVAATKE